MTVLLKTADLTQEKFLDLIKNLSPDSNIFPCHIWLEAPDGWTLDGWDWQASLNGKLRWFGAGDEPIEERSQDCLTKSTAGRLFAAEGELRWRNIPSLGPACWRTVFLGNVDWVGTALDDHSDHLNNLHPSQDSFFLWGQQTPVTPDEWIELRIPHRFQYPITGNPDRVKVVIEQWSDDTGEPHFVRLCNLEPV
jgi:hypothetical protein